MAFEHAGVYVNDFAATISQNAVSTFFHYRPKDLSDPEFHGIIASALLMNGIATEIAGSSRPASASEHLISHAYDEVTTRPSLHGLQVGVPSYAVSFLQQITHEAAKHVIQDCGFVEYMAHHPLDRAGFVEAIRRAPDVKSDFYTLLSEPKAVSRLVEFATTDPLITRMVR